MNHEVNRGYRGRSHPGTDLAPRARDSPRFLRQRPVSDWCRLTLKNILSARSLRIRNGMLLTLVLPAATALVAILTALYYNRDWLWHPIAYGCPSGKKKMSRCLNCGREFDSLATCGGTYVRESGPGSPHHAYCPRCAYRASLNMVGRTCDRSVCPHCGAHYGLRRDYHARQYDSAYRSAWAVPALGAARRP